MKLKNRTGSSDGKVKADSSRHKGIMGDIRPWQSAMEHLVEISNMQSDYINTFWHRRQMQFDGYRP